MLEIIAPFLQYAPQVAEAFAKINEGKAKKREAQRIADQKEREAKQAEAEAQREFIEEKRKAKFMESRAIAVAAASGAGGAEDPTVSKLLSDIEGEGEYRALSSLYGGYTDAKLARAQAGAVINEGRAARRAANLSAATTILGAGADFYTKYGTPKKSKPPKRFDSYGDYNYGYTRGLA